MIISAPDGGYFKSELSPFGFVYFTHNRNGKTTAQEVPKDACWQLTPRGWSLSRRKSRFEAYRPVYRVSANHLEMSFADEPLQLYRYHIVDGAGGPRHVFEIKENNQWWPVRNRSRIASLNYFLTNESLMEKNDA